MLKGNDPVAYLTENRATQGLSSTSYNWNAASLHFTTPKHHDLFAVDSENFAPKYGASERSV